MSEFADVIRDRRTAKGLTVRELARRTGIVYSAISQWECGARIPSNGRWIPILAAELDIDPANLTRLLIEATVKKHEGSNTKPRSSTEIEAIAAARRKEAFRRLGRDYFVLPRDLTQLPRVLAGLHYIEVPHLLSSSHRAGLFPPGTSFEGTDGAIVVADDKVTPGRFGQVSNATKLFQIAHELGHYYLDWPHDSLFVDPLPTAPHEPMYCSFGGKEPRELFANRFAAAFLIPERELRSQLRQQNSISWREESDQLCEHFSVESWMLKKRIDTLGIKVR